MIDHAHRQCSHFSLESEKRKVCPYLGRQVLTNSKYRCVITSSRFSQKVCYCTSNKYSYIQEQDIVTASKNDLKHLTASVHSSYIGAEARVNAAFGQGSGPVLLSNVGCTGLEPRLLECPSSGLETVYCSHSQDAGVVCRTGIYTSDKKMLQFP